MTAPTDRPTAAGLLRLARWLVLALILCSLVANAAGALLFPAFAARHAADVGGPGAWSPPQIQAALSALGWSPAVIAWFGLFRAVPLLLVSTAITLILWRRADDWFRLYTAFTLTVLPTYGAALDALVAVVPALRPLRQFGGAYGWQLFFILLYVFPNGRFVPRWTRWLILGWIGNALYVNLIADSRSPVSFVVSIALVLAAIGSQAYRYIARSDALERQQTKWVVFALAVLLAVGVIYGLAAGNVSALIDSLGAGSALMLALALQVLLDLALLSVFAAIALAILRYRLWDIDVIIRRTLVYSLLTALLALAYFGSVLVLQGIIRTLTGEAQSPLVTVLSTLAIAGLALPLRARVQGFIDRRFYRRKVDAARTLAAFAATARDETNLERLTAQLAAVVDETMQPEHVRLWLKPLSGSRMALPDAAPENRR